MTDAAPLQPPAPQSAFALEAPAPVQRRVHDGQAPGDGAAIDEAALPGLDAKVAEYVDSLVALDVHSPDVRGQGRRRARRWATTTSAPRPTRRTGCSQSPVRGDAARAA